jgi:ABC-type taurine transport system ATPase subunit
MVRGSLKVTIASKKLMLLEKILQKREPDYEKVIEGIFGDSRRVSVSRVVAKDKDTLFLEMPRLFESLDIGSRDMQTSPMEIKKAIETGNGIIRGFYWEWCTT